MTIKKRKTSAEIPKSDQAGANDSTLRNRLRELLRGRGAHADFDSAIAGLPGDLRGKKPAGAAHTAWQILEHLRIAQWDILEFSRNPRHVSPEFPSGYWPPTEAPADDAAWDASVRAFRSDLGAMIGLISAAADLFAPVPHPDASQEHTLLREALILADHNSYHLGELVLLRRLLGSWPAD